MEALCDTSEWVTMDDGQITLGFYDSASRIDRASASALMLP